MNHKYNPTDEQRKFINDSSNFLIVSAGPGSGKTETLIQYLIKNIERKANNDKSHLKKVVVCSFTKNSTNEIKNRFSTNFNLVAGELVIFQTFDSFLINQIWKFYFGRIVRFAINHFFFQENDVTFPLRYNKIVFSKLSWENFDKKFKIKQELKNEVFNFINYAKNGILLVGFVAEYILLEYITNNKQVVNYLESFFSRIVIDEAQDLSALRYLIILELYKQSKINVTLVGDQRQSIYQFLGSVSNVFDWIQKKIPNLTNKLLLTKNFRFKNIDDPINEDVKKMLGSSNRDNFINNIRESIGRSIIESKDIIQEVKRLEGTILFLTNTNEKVKTISQYLHSHNIDNRCILKIPYEWNVGFEEQFFIENLYIYNMVVKGELRLADIKHNLVEDICHFLWPYDPRYNEKFLKLFWNNNTNFSSILEKIEKLVSIPKMDYVIQLFDKNKNYISSLPEKDIQVMTIHAAKGLEADNIFIDREMLNKFLNKERKSVKFQTMFVALSRSKSKIFIFEEL